MMLSCQQSIIKFLESIFLVPGKSIGLGKELTWATLPCMIGFTKEKVRQIGVSRVEPLKYLRIESIGFIGLVKMVNIVEISKLGGLCASRAIGNLMVGVKKCQKPTKEALIGKNGREIK